jgi:hypothetical protein
MFDVIRKSLLGKLTLSITLAALIPLLIFNFAFFHLLSQNYTRDRINNIKNILGQISLGVSADIETYHEYASYLANDMTIMGFVTFEQNASDIIETVNHYIKPWVNRLYYGNEMIQSIRIIHNNSSLFNVNNLLFETDEVKDKITRLAQLNDSTRIPIKAIEYQQTGHLYSFTPYSMQDHDVWYLYHAIAPVSRTHSPGLIEIAVHNDLLFNRISELTFEPDSFMIVVTDNG